MNYIPVENRVIHDSVESNLVYPIEKGYKLVCQIEPEWFEEQLRRIFGGDVKYINNKYAITLNDHLYYQHDRTIWLIEQE